MGLYKTNTDWRLLDEKHRLYSRTKGWWESLHISQAYNCTMAPIQWQQWGGTALFSLNWAAHRVVERSIDEL